MKTLSVNLRDVPRNGFKFQDTLCKDTLNSRLQGASGNQARFLSAPTLELLIRSEVFGSVAKGSVTCELDMPCARCTDTNIRVVKVYLNFTMEAREEFSYQESDNIVPKGTKADITEYVYDTILLSIDPFWSPEYDSEKRCTVCKEVFGPCVFKDKLNEREQENASLGTMLHNIIGQSKAQ